VISKDKKYRTKSGREVRIYAVDGGGRYPVHGAIFVDGTWSQENWKSDGSNIDSLEDSLSLIEVKPRIQHAFWLNVYRGSLSTNRYNTKELADLNAVQDRIACVKITIDCEEGEGL